MSNQGEKLNLEQAIKDAYTGKLKKNAHGLYEVPSILFVAKVDLKMPELPDIAFYTYTDGQKKLLKEKGKKLSALVFSSHPSVFVEESDFVEIQKYAENCMTSLNGPSKMEPKARMETLRQAAISTVEDLFKDPSPENIKKSKRVVGSFVYVMMREPETYLFLARLSSHDPYTLQHSVGAAVNSIILGRKMGTNDPAALEEIGLGGLLHDIGKVHVKKEIINKEGPLDDAEWEEMRQHSLLGYEIVKNNPDVSDRAKMAILEHHEDKNQGGYPHKTPWNDLEMASKIVGISDIFNALTTDRSYSKARSPFEAFHLMREKLTHKIDDELFRQLVLIYGGKLGDIK